MPVTINVNNLTLCHKGSNGISTATIPDVCKTPSPGGPVPIPYPNIAFSMDLMKGTTTVKADCGMMCANYGSEFFKSTGDEPGVVGGVVSSTFIKEATWITFSFDVKLQGKAACRLTDKMFHNHQNTVNMAGLIQMFLQLGEIFVLCKLMCECIAQGDPHQSCVQSKLDAADAAAGGLSPAKAEVPFDMRQSPPQALPSPWPGGTQYQQVRIGVKGGTTPGAQAGRDFPSLGAVGRGQVRIPDVTLLNDPSKPPAGNNIAGLVEMKFPGDKSFDNSKVKAQLADYDIIAHQHNPNANVYTLNAERCGCNGPRDPVPVPELRYANEKLKQRQRTTNPAPAPAPAPAPSGWHIPTPSPTFWKVAAGLTLLAVGTVAVATGVGAPAGGLVGAAGVALIVGGVPMNQGGGPPPEA